MFRTRLLSDSVNPLLTANQILGLVCVVVVLHLIAEHHFLLFHTLVELLRVVVLTSLFALAWHTRQWSENHFLKVVGVAAVFIAGIELLHALTYHNIGLIGNNDPNLPTQLWVAFRYLEAGSFLVAVLLVNRPLPLAWVLGCLVLLKSGLLLAIYTGVFPDSYLSPGGLTDFKIASEYLIAGMFVIAMALMFHRRDRFSARVHWLVQASLLFNILATISFTRYVSVYGFANELGHYFLFLSAYLIYRGVLVTGLVTPYKLLFRDLKRHEEHLSELVEERTARLHQSEQMNQSFFDNSPAVILLCDPAGRITMANPAFAELAGKNPAALVGLSLGKAVMPDLAQRISHLNATASRTRRSVTSTERVTLAGESRIFEAIHFPLFNKQGAVSGTGAIATEVTEHRRLQANYELMVKASMDALLLLDASGRIVQVNHAATSLTGYRQDELVGMTLAQIEVDLAAERLRSFLDNIANQRATRRESRWRRKNGDLCDIEMSVQLFDDAVTSGFCAFVRDVTKQREDLRRIEFLARYDALTELPNRAHFEELAQQHLQADDRDRQKVLVYIDLDNFKDINDALGHYMGDTLIREIGQRLLAVSGPDRLFARASGDEFMALLELNTGEAQLSAELAHIQQLASQPVGVNGHMLFTTVSMGVSVYPRDGEDFTSLYRSADTAMYAAKSDGRNTWRLFDRSMQQRAAERQQLLGKLRGALANQELSVHFQPQLDLSDQRLLGAEALLRWHNPELGQVSPARFIPIAEESGLINEIGDWVLGEVCRQGRQWRESGLPPITLAVNLSAIQFQRHDLAPTVARILEETGFDGSLLELELTETVLAGDEKRVVDTIRQLKDYQIHLAIDDFGTGYSSMAYLNRFSVDKLKIDQSFIRNMAEDGNSASVVNAIIRLAHSLDMRVIAEGVETEEHVTALTRLGCDEVQGYYFARPMDADAFSAYLAASTVGGSSPRMTSAD